MLISFNVKNEHSKNSPTAESVYLEDNSAARFPNDSRAITSRYLLSGKQNSRTVERSNGVPDSS
jgi:hypothetical protein